jgi:hypothetical protein
MRPRYLKASNLRVTPEENLLPTASGIDQTERPFRVRLRNPDAESGGPLYPQEETWSAGSNMSEKCQHRTYALAASGVSSH